MIKGLFRNKNRIIFAYLCIKIAWIQLKTLHSFHPFRQLRKWNGLAGQLG